MLTPRFKLSQDDNHVFITVHAPYTNIGETEIDIDGENFLFVSSPYFLRLRLPGRIIEDERSKGTFSSDDGDFNLKFNKETPGEHFDNLDMITSLLAPREIPNINPDLVEMLEEDGITFTEESHDENKRYAYGFASKITTEFRDIGNEFPQIFELRIPEQVTADERQDLRIKHEDEKFSSDHYLADYFDEELIEPYLKLKQVWEDPDFTVSDFNEDEVTLLKELPNKNFLLSPKEYKQILLGLIDILFGYCYDKRTTLNESTVESSWTINKLSSTLSWFCVFNDVKQVLTACYRRALTYPIFRNFELCNKVKGDLILLLKKGKKLAIKSLIDIHQMFNTSNDARYILNQLYIKDYLIFLQKCKNSDFDELYQNITNVEIEKNDLDLDLLELEHAANLVQHEEADIMENEVAVKLASMSLLPGIRKVNGNVEEYGESSSEYSTDSSSDYTSSDLLDSDDDP